MFLREQVVTNSDATTLMEGLTYCYTTYPQVLWMIVYLFVVVAPIIALSTFHTSLIARDATTYETMTKFSRSPGMAPKPFSMGRVLAVVQHGEGVFESPPTLPTPSVLHV